MSSRVGTDELAQRASVFALAPARLGAKFCRGAFYKIFDEKSGEEFSARTQRERLALVPDYFPGLDQSVSSTASPFFTTVAYTLSSPLWSDTP